MDKENLKVIEDTLTNLLSKSMDGMKGDLSTLVEAKFNKFLEENKLTKSDLAAGRLPINGGDVETKYQRIGNFIKAAFTRDASLIAKGMTEGTDSAGGYLVPEEFHAEVVRIAKDYGLVAKFATRFPMGSDTLNLPAESTSVTVYWPGEATAGTGSQPVLANAQLLAKSLVGITVTSNELLADAKVDVTKYLMTIFAEAFAGEIDNQAFNGSGSPFTGILSASVTIVTMASGQDTFAETKLTDLRDLISNVQTSCLPTSAFYMHRLTWGTIQKIQENSSTVAAIAPQPINMGLGQSDVGLLKPAGYLWGYPVYLSDTIVSTTAVSTKFVIFGSLAKGLFWGDREQSTMKISQDGVVNSVSMFETNQSAVRLTQRVAVKVGLPTAFAVLKTAAS